MIRLILCFVCFIPCWAQDTSEPRSGVYIILDLSGSMWGELPDKTRKIETAKKALKEFLKNDFEDRELAFRVYGHRAKASCQDSTLIVPFGDAADNAAKIEKAMESLQPLGQTPIGLSLKAALKDFGNRSGDIVLITDGKETCGVDPCALLRVWRKDNVAVRVHVVGLGMGEREKKSIECISRAAGTVYHDADSAESLAAGLGKIKKTVKRGGFYLKGIDKDGTPLPITGTVVREKVAPIRVASHRRHRIEPGVYTLTAGVETLSGNLYRPVTQQIKVLEDGDTVITVRVLAPPLVKTVFREKGKEVRGGQIRVFQDGRLVFQFRSVDEVYVDEGTYEFRAKPNRENDLSVTATVGAGETKKIVFEMTPTVHVKIKMSASGSGIWYRYNYELRQDGKRKYTAHARNGVRMLPGTYDIWMSSNLTPFVKRDVIITEKENQNIDIVVPSGHVTIIYQNGEGGREQDKRCFLGRGPDHRGNAETSGTRIPLTPGTYNATGWRGDYEKAIFTIQAGDEKEIILKPRD